MASPRSTEEVLQDHLRLRREGRTDEDLERNYDDDVVVLSHLGQFRGIDGMSTLAALLAEQLKDARYHYDMVLVDGEFGFLRWTAEAADFTVSDGADSYCVRDGRIVAQTLAYSLSSHVDQLGDVEDV